MLLSVDYLHANSSQIIDPMFLLCACCAADGKQIVLPPFGVSSVRDGAPDRRLSGHLWRLPMGFELPRQVILMIWTTGCGSPLIVCHLMNLPMYVMAIRDLFIFSCAGRFENDCALGTVAL